MNVAKNNKSRSNLSVYSDGSDGRNLIEVTWKCNENQMLQSLNDDITTAGSTQHLQLSLLCRDVQTFYLWMCEGILY